MDRIASGRIHFPSLNHQLHGRVGHVGRWLIWLMLIATVASTLARDLPESYRDFATLGRGGHLSPATIRAGVAELGIPLSAHVFISFARHLLFGLGFILVGALLFVRAPYRKEAFIFSIYLILAGFFELDADYLRVDTSPILSFAGNLLFSALFFGCYLFPDGQFSPGLTRWLALLWVAMAAGLSFFPGSPVDLNTWPTALNAPVAAALVLSAPASIFYRYHKQATPLQKRQIKWVIFGITLASLGFILYWVPLGLFPELGTTPKLAVLFDITVGTASFLTLLAIPSTIGLAVMRARLWDIEPLVSRTLVFALLTLGVLAIYVAVVGYFAQFLQIRNNQFVSLLATAIVAVSLQPLRQKLQRGVNRLVFGLREEPYTALSKLCQRLSTITTGDELLAAIVHTVEESLRLPYVALALKESDTDNIQAAVGRPNGATERLPIFHQGEHVGDLLFTGRTPELGLSAFDYRLLEDLAGQAGAAIQAIRVTGQLRRLNDELMLVRTQLVTTREEERRRLRRELHDEIGSMLASINLRAGAVKLQLARDAPIAEAMINELQAMVKEALTNVRQLARTLRPPVLDELGLREAILELAAQFNGGHFSSTEGDAFVPPRVAVDINGKLPPIPAAVEVAAYRIISEAVSNAYRHASASNCLIKLVFRERCLLVEVLDDGIGPPQALRAGVGIMSMRERAAELGGAFFVERRDEGGTVVSACLPLMVLGRDEDDGFYSSFDCR